MDAASRRRKEKKDIRDFYEGHKNSNYAFILMDLSPQNIEEYKLLFPELKFEQSYGGCTSVTIRH